MAGQRVIVSVLADTKAFKRSMNDLGNVSGFNKLKSGLKTAATRMAQLTAAAGALGIALGTKAVSAAADLEQSMGAIDDIFKAGSAQMHEFSAAAADSVGLSKNSYNELATTLGALLKNGGTSIDELGGKTNDLITLGADLSAMFGGSTTDAVNALSSALKGERDPIERYGVSLRQSAIDAKAAELGFEKVGGSLSAEATQAATLALIMEQTTDAHGKFGRESGTLQNRVQVLKAKLENAAATLGEYLLPVVTTVVSWLVDRLGPALEKVKGWLTKTVIPAVKSAATTFKDEWLPAIKNVGTWIKDNVLPVLKTLGSWITGTGIPAIKNMVTWLKNNWQILAPFAAAIGGVVVAWRTYKTTMATVNAVTTGYKAAQAALNAVMKANPIGLVITAIAGLIAGLVTLYHTNEGFREVVDKVWNAIKNVVNTVVTWFTDTALPAIQGFIDGISTAWNNVKTWTTETWNKVKTTISDVWNTIKTTVTTAIDTVKTKISNVWTTITTNTSTTWTTVKDTVTTAWTNIKTGISNGISNVKTVIKNLPGNVVSWLGNLGSTLWTKGRDLIQGLRDGIDLKVTQLTAIMRNLPNRIISWIGNLGRTLWNAGKDLIQGFIDGIGNMFNAVRSKLGELTSALTSWKGPPAKDKVLLTKNGQLIIDGFIKGLESRYGQVRRSLAGMTDSLSGEVSADLRAGATLSLTSSGHGYAAAAAPVSINIELHTLRPDADTARAVHDALRDWERLNGRRRL